MPRCLTPALLTLRRALRKPPLFFAIPRLLRARAALSADIFLHAAPTLMRSERKGVRVLLFRRVISLLRSALISRYDAMRGRAPMTLFCAVIERVILLMISTRHVTPAMRAAATRAARATPLLRDASERCHLRDAPFSPFTMPTTAAAFAADRCFYARSVLRACAYAPAPHHTRRRALARFRQRHFRPADAMSAVILR